MNDEIKIMTNDQTINYKKTGLTKISSELEPGEYFMFCGDKTHKIYRYLSCGYFGDLNGPKEEIHLFGSIFCVDIMEQVCVDIMAQAKTI